MSKTSKSGFIIPDYEDDADIPALAQQNANAAESVIKAVSEKISTEFSEDAKRENINSGEKLSVILGKIKKWFSDLKAVAFSNNYNDLDNKPTSLKNPYSLTIRQNSTSGGTSYDGSSSATVNITAAGVGAAPTSHAVSAATYGAGSGSNYGHVKLSDSTDSTLSTGGGTAATPNAVKKTYDFAANKARTATLVVAASNSGAKSKAAADYVCDGTSDQTEINNAITALPSVGGKVLLLEGTYNISGTITVGKANVTVEGMGAGTVLKRKTTSDLIKINANNCALSYFCIDGADTTTSNSVGGISSDYGPMISHLTISEYGAAIRVNNGAVITGCVLSTKSFVCVFAGTDCIIAHNRINGTDNPVQGIQVYGKTAVIGNYIDSTGIGIQTYNQYNKIADNFITGCTKSINVEGTYNDISDNFIFGTNYTNLGGNTNTFSNNRYQ